VTRHKILAVLISAGGVILVSLHSVGQTDAKSDGLGISLVLISMGAFAIYEVLFKLFDHKRFLNAAIEEVYPGDPDLVDASDALIVLAVIGIFHLVFGPLLVLIWHYAGWETFELPPDRHTWKVMLANAALDTGFNIFFLIGIALSSPFFMAMSLLLSIPVSILLDWLWKGYLFSVEEMVGALLVAVGFALLSWTEYSKQKEDPKPQTGRLQSKSRSIISTDLDDEHYLHEDHHMAMDSSEM